MDRIWQWACDRYPSRYSWVLFAISFAVLLLPYLIWSFLVVAFEKSDHYPEATVVTVVAVIVLVYMLIRPNNRMVRLVLPARLPGLADRGSHELKGKSAAVQVFALDTWPSEN